MSEELSDQVSETLCRYLAAVLDREELELNDLRDGHVLLEALHVM